MIARISGRVAEVSVDQVLIETGGLTYQVSVPPVVSTSLAPGAEVVLETVHFLQIEQNRATPMLVGFLTETQKTFWEVLAGVLGPRSAVKAFSSPADAIARWIEMGDVASLKTLQGIGQAKAREMVAKLQGKLGKFASESAAAPSGARPDAPMFAAPTGPASEAIEALVGLDYKRSEAAEFVARAIQTNPDLDSVNAILDEVFRRK